LVLFTGYWFIFFKMEERVYLLLPELSTSSDYNPFNILFACVLASKFLTILFKITFEQCGFDLFLIDWERPKIRYEYQGSEKMGVNAWRGMFLLNEFHELQTDKLINIEFTLFVYILIMEGCGWKYFSTYDPTFHNTDQKSPYNYVLQFFFTAIIMYAIGICQYVIRYVLKFKYPLKCEQFVDLCSICNISLLMFDHSFHGYYIHGKSPYG
jgi:meckelin